MRQDHPGETSTAPATGTSLGAIGSRPADRRWRVLAVIVATVWADAIVLGLTADALGIG